MLLFEKICEDEKKVNRDLYTSGPYWSLKNIRAIREIREKGILNFRGSGSSLGSSFTDNEVIDTRDMYSNKGRIFSKIFSLPLINKIFNDQISLTNNYLERYLQTLSVIYKSNENVIKLIGKYQFEDTTSHGCIKQFNFKNKLYSTHYLDTAHRMNILSDFFDFSKTNSLFEIGGGYGANIHFLLSNFTNIKKVIYLDIFPNIYIGTEYLRHHFGSSVKDYLDTVNLKKIRFSNNSNLEILCIPPWEIEKLDVEIDHFHNASSFVEMPKETISNYCKFIKKFKIKEVSLLSYDGYDLNTTFDPQDLNNFFDNKLEIFWKDELISDFNRKFIYLLGKNIK